MKTTDTLKSINTTPHLCRNKVKQTALEIVSAIRPANKFSRGGMSFVDHIEAKVRIPHRLANIPSPSDNSPR